MGWDGFNARDWDEAERRHFAGFAPHLLERIEGERTGAARVFWAIHEGKAGGEVIVCHLAERDARGMFWFKVMDESVAPYFYSVPLSWLDRVPAPACPWPGVPSWRDKVRALAAGRPLALLLRAEGV
jgi:hypothetical protein